MNIATTCNSWSIEHHRLEEQRRWVTDLHCKAKKDNGEWISTQLRLDDILGNDDGNFKYSLRYPERNISSSMSNPRLEVTGDGRPILHGRLTTRDAYAHDRSLDLSKILWNKDGRLSLNEDVVRAEDERRREEARQKMLEKARRNPKLMERLRRQGKL
ncbi:CVNH domain-containing protein [Aspergillus novoparasiticus]|uniref:CVNH domain-containing protein n=1 Tax=Aspergillus novoparasiticus TaxID=986946 RepID=A0A5N6EM92_9EURO|nr:CVNH domain-containing protein [Aspergillus novoparasiticus]